MTDQTVRAIWKFDLETGPVTIIEMDADAELLGVRLQSSAFGTGLKLWAVVNPDAPKVERRFVIVPTGGQVLAEDKFVSSVELSGGVMIHVFEAI